MISQEEWDAWSLHPVTKVMRQHFRLRREDILDSWSSGAFTGPSSAETIQKNAQAIGAAQAYAEVSELSYEQLKETEK